MGVFWHERGENVQQKGGKTNVNKTRGENIHKALHGFHGYKMDYTDYFLWKIRVILMKSV
jgi:hypothetical protein